jgi:hypothetical protein
MKPKKPKKTSKKTVKDSRTTTLTQHNTTLPPAVVDTHLVINGRCLTDAHLKALQIAVQYFTTELAGTFAGNLSDMGKDYLVKLGEIAKIVGMPRPELGVLKSAQKKLPRPTLGDVVRWTDTFDPGEAYFHVGRVIGIDEHDTVCIDTGDSGIVIKKLTDLIR